MKPLEQRMRQAITWDGCPVSSIYEWQKKCGVPESTFYAVFKNRRAPGLAVAFLIAEAGDMTVDDLFGPDY